MKLSQEQQRVKELISDTITRLCLSGLAFKTEFSIEALVGITLDNTDVILFNINETVCRTVSKSSQQKSEEQISASCTVDNGGTVVGSESVSCTTSNVPTPVSVPIFPVKCTRSTTGKMVAISVPSTASPSIVNIKPIVSGSLTKTYVKILPKGTTVPENPNIICNVPLIMTTSKRGRRKRHQSQGVIKTTTESCAVTNFSALPNASEPSEKESETANGSNVSDFPSLSNSTMRFGDGDEIFVKEEPIDDDYGPVDSDILLADRTDAEDVDAQDNDAEMTAENEMQEHDAYVRDICVNEHRLSQSEVDESMQEEDTKEEFSTFELQPDDNTRGFSDSGGAAGPAPDISKRSLAQIRRRQGLPYINGKGEFISGKQMKPQNCSRCKLRCAEKLSESDRHEIFTQFWQMGPQQVSFVQNYVREVPVQFLTLGHQSRRSRTLQYYLPAGHEKVKVCRDMFLNTLNLSVNTLYTKLAK